MSPAGRRPASVGAGRDPHDRTDSGDRSLELRDVDADLHVLAEVRELLSSFATEVGASEQVTADLRLAAYEALANVVEHAYRPGEAGTFDLVADYRDDEAILGLTICDHGSWNPGDGVHRDARRGRGLQLMRAASDSLEVDTDAAGTRVRMHWVLGSADTPRPHHNRRDDR